MTTNFDIIIAGGGLAGNCLAIALADSGMRIASIEAQTREQLFASPAGDRALALSAGTVGLLQALNLWSEIQHKAVAIEHIHVSDQGHFGKTRLSASQFSVKALGYVICARDIEDHLSGLVEQSNITRFTPARVVALTQGAEMAEVEVETDEGLQLLTAPLVVGADGGQSTIRKLLSITQQITDYGQFALVTTVNTTLPHKNTAFERFTESGPLAMLPMPGNTMAVVWTRQEQEAKALLSGSDIEFNGQLQRCFGYKLGEISVVSPRRVFPLQLIHARKFVSARAVIIGNAVHQLHPVAGQGFNLGLRDVLQLADMLLAQWESGKDLGEAKMLSRFASMRKSDHDSTITLTDGLVKIFSNEWLSVAAARNVGLMVLDHLPVVKALFARQTMGLTQRQPRVGSKR